MRRMLLLISCIALFASSQGCCKCLCRKTVGGCDCYAPPVESLLQAPCPRPGHPLGDDYAPAPRSPLPTTQPPTALPAQGGEPAAKQPEAIKVLPKVIEKDK